MKKLAILLAIILTLSTQASASLLSTPELTESSFTDMEDYSSYYRSIEWMEQNEIVSGYEDGSFRAGNCVTRAEFLKMMYKTKDMDVTQITVNENPFKDIEKTVWYSPYIQLAKENKSINGYEDGTFRPDQCISRAEAIKIASLEFNNNSIPEIDFFYISADSYSDIPINSWYYTYIDYVIKANLVGTEHTFDTYDSETGLSKFLPTNPMTRGEAAEMFYRFRAMKDNSKNQYDYFDEPAIPEEDLFYNNCSKDSFSEAKLESNILNAISKDASLVIGIDHSNSSQLKNVEKILSTITKQEFWKTLAEESSELNLAIDSKWSAAMGITVIEESTEDPQVVLAGEFENADEFEKIFGDMVAKEMNYSTICTKFEGLTYWTSEDNDFYFVKYDDVFIATNNGEELERAINRLQKNSGFSFSNNLDKDSLAYMYISEDIIAILENELENEIDSIYPSELTKTLSSIGNIYGYIKSDSEGFLFSTEAVIKDPNDELIKKYINRPPTFANKVPGQNTLLYAEDLDLGMILDIKDSTLAETTILSELATEIGVTKEELKSLLSDSYAISITDTDTVVPTMSFYLNFSDTNRATADKTVQTIDKWITEWIYETPSLGTVSEVYLKDIITKSTTSQGLTKITLDADKLPIDSSDPEEIEMATTIKNELKESGAELYYGIIDDNTLVIAFYPNFETKYETSPLSNDSTFIEAIGKLGEVYGARLTFINIDNITSYFVKLINIAPESSYEILNTEDLEPIKEIAGMFKYFVSSTSASENLINVKAFLKVGN